MADQEEIHRKACSSNANDRRAAAEILVSSFSDLPDKDLAWVDLHRLAKGP